MNEVIFDFEGNGLKPTLIHVFSYSINGGEVLSTTDPNVIKSILEDENNYVIGHNILRFDIPNLERLLNFETKAKPIDTLGLSWYLFPQRPKHGLAYWAPELGHVKPEIEDWFELDYQAYKHRCEEDVKTTATLWNLFKERLVEIYTGGSKKTASPAAVANKIFELIKYLNFKLSCAYLQEKNGWRLDVNRTKENLATLVAIKEDKVNQLKASMPPVQKFKTVEPPAKLRKKDGSYTKQAESWFSLLKELGLHTDHYDPVEIVTDLIEPNPNSHDQLKSWLFGLGWEPETFKQNKDKKEIPQIGVLDGDKKGELCPSVLALAEKEPAILNLQSLFVLNHRIGILEGFLENVNEEGRVVAKVDGFTNTLRFKHSVIVNLPGVNKPFGEYIRPCLIADDGYELCGSDMASLEDRTKQHFMWPYDSGYVKEMMTPDFDPHLDLAVVGGMMTIEEVKLYKEMKKNKEKPPKNLEIIRHGAKTTNYSCTYGAFPPKIARTAKISLEQAELLHETYWKRNWAIEEIAKNASVINLDSDGSLWILNPVNGFYYSLRKQKDRFSTLNQGTGAYCFDVWMGCVLKRRNQLTAQFHDEGVWQIKKGHREDMIKLLRDAIDEANSMLKLNRELDIGIQFGDNYGEIH